MSVEILNHQNERISFLRPELERLLASAPLSPDTIRLLDEFHRRRQRLKCGCGRLLHVVMRDHPFLRRNPNQPTTGRECALCENTRSDNQPASHTARKQPPTGIGLVLGTRLHPQPAERRDRDDDRRERNAPGLKYQRAFSVLFQIMKQARFTSLPAALTWDEMWRRLHAVLSGVRLHPRTDRTLADFAWTPGLIYRGGLNNLNTRLTTTFRHPELQPEGWVFGIADELSTAGRIDLWPTSSRDRETAAAQQRTVYPPYKLEVPPHNVSAIGRTGPFLVFVICSANDRDDPRFAKPTAQRLLLQAIASEDCPVPVESNHEREVVALLQRLGVKFYKPVFDTPDGLRPDFVLPSHRILLEVQGVNTEEYRLHKREVHERLRASPTFPGHELILHNPNDGETIARLEATLKARLARR